MSIVEKDLQNIWHPYTQIKGSTPPIAIVRGEGVYLFDEQGNSYIDAISSWWVNVHGHSHPHIAEKVAEQLNTLEHVIFAGFTHPKAVELAERLLKLLPEKQSKIFFSDNGSTAVEVAVKMALQYWHNKGIEKRKVIALEGAYHGDTFGAMSVSERSAFSKPFASLLFDVIHIEFPGKGREDVSLKQLKDALAGGDIAAFIFEPLVQGASGMRMYGADILEKMIACCRKNKVLTIADEVMTGFGRTGKFFASDHLSEKPDMCCLSKGLTGGTMAMGITSCTQQVFDAFSAEDKSKTFFHGHSFTANPLACAASCASLDIFEKPLTWQRIRQIEEKHAAFVKESEGHALIKDIRQKGTILAIELETDEKPSYFSDIGTRIRDYFISKGIILRPLGNVLYVLPPYCITDNELDKIYEAINTFLEAG